ncbi:nuclease-related domain-containing protein [Metabacillus sp. RGM 3146]|uniref:nuclease-related domain-containing protein n=1 Tax=Metabacillus sp. RGM 3146 TaxID=3401092 RepID=UPI003B9C3755
MIEKERKVPRSILKLEALIQRLPQGHPKSLIIMEELAKRKAGFSGEKSLDYYFSFFEGKEVSIFHDLRLKDESRYFQIDTLFLTRHYALIIEVKNLAGTLYFDPVFNQLIRTIEEKETAFPDPLIQVNRQEHQLKNWLLKNKLPFIPIESIIVITNSQSIIRTSPNNKNLSKKIIRSENLLTKIQHIEESVKAV